MTSSAWKAYDNTKINRDLLQSRMREDAYVLTRFDNPYYHLQLDHRSLLAFPVLRLLAFWQYQGHTGLTPFALSAIVEKSPREVLAQVLKEQHATLQFCSTTWLPVLVACSRRVIFKDLQALGEDYKWNMEDYYCGKEADDALPPGLPTQEELNLTAMLDRFGGEDWAKFCKVNFSYGIPCTRHPDLKLMRRIYDLSLTAGDLPPGPQSPGRERSE